MNQTRSFWVIGETVSLLCAVCLLLVNCVSYPPQEDGLVDPAVQRVYIERDIERAIRDNPLLAVQIINNQIESSDLFEPEDIEVYQQQTALRLDELAQQSLMQNDFYAYRGYIKSKQYLISGNDSALLDTAVQQYFIGYITSLLEQQSYALLMHELLYYDNFSSFDTPLLQEIVNVAFEHNYTQILTDVLEVLANRGSVSAIDESRVTAPSPVTFEEMLTGTVTVIVDRGVKIERGVGVQDRVFGSGFFVDKNGYLITNYHVISTEVDPKYRGYSRLYVRLYDSDTDRIPAKVVSYDPIIDIALLKVEIEPQYIFPIVSIGNTLKPGTEIFALGSPAGLQNTVTSGIISASKRIFLQFGETLQIDAPVNPGNSGGPLIDSEGQLAGVVFAGIPQLEGVNFAIPVRWLSALIPKLFLHSGQIPHYWLGLHLADQADAIAVRYQYPQTTINASSNDIDIGDRLIAIDNNSYSTIEDYQLYLMTLYAPQIIKTEWSTDEVAGTASSAGSSTGNTTFTRYFQVNSRPTYPLLDIVDDLEPSHFFNPLYGMATTRIGGVFSNDYMVDGVVAGSYADEINIVAGDTFRFIDWTVERDKRYVIMQIILKKFANSYTESGLQIIGLLDIPSFI